VSLFYDAVEWPISLFEMLLQGIMVVVFINRCPDQNDEYNYHDSLQAYLIEGIVH